MSVKIPWPPKDYTQLVALVRIIVKEGEKASMPVFQEQLGISKSTINRYFYPARAGDERRYAPRRLLI